MGERHFRRILAALLALILLISAACCALAEEEEEDPFVTHKAEYEQQLISRANRIYAQEVNAYGSVDGYITRVNHRLRDYVNDLSNASIYSSWANYYCDFTAALVDVGLAVLGNVHGTVTTVGTTLEITVAELAKEVCGEVMDYAWNEVIEELNLSIPPMTRQEFIYSQAKLAEKDVSIYKLSELMQRAKNNGASFPTGKDAMDFIITYQKNKSAFATMDMGLALYHEEMNYAWYDWLGKIGEAVAVSQLADKLFGTDDLVADHIIGNLSSQTTDYLTLVANKFNDPKITEWANKLQAIELQTAMLLRYDWQEPIVYPPQHTVYLDANGGDLARDSITVYEGWTYGYIPTPDRFGYNFLGWFDAPEGGSVVTKNDTYDLTADQTLYAHWERIVLSQGSCGPNLTYIQYGDGLLEIAGSGEMTEKPWQDNRLCIAEVHLPEGLTNIEEYAFHDCPYLREITIPGSVTVIEDGAFQWSGLLRVNLSTGLREIGREAFANTYLTALTLPQGVVSLGNDMIKVVMAAARSSAFDEGDLPETPYVTELVIPASVETMDFALRDSRVQRVTFEAGRTEIPQNACSGAESMREVVIPEGVEIIGQSAFDGCASLTNLALPASLREIHTWAFSGTGLTSLNLPDGIDQLGYAILSGNTGVKDFTLPAGAGDLQSIYSDGILIGSSVERLILAPGSKEVPGSICRNVTTLTSVTLPDTVERINGLAFSGCTGLTEITLPSALKQIDYGAFAESGLMALSLPQGVISLDLEMLRNTPVTELTVPASVETMFDALSGSNVRRVVFETGRTVIPQEACRSATALQEVVIPEGIELISQSAFSGCMSLTDLSLPASLKEIYPWAFSDTGLTSLNLPDGVEWLGYAILSGNTGVKEFTLPAGATCRPYLGNASILIGSGVEHLILAPGAKTVPQNICQNVTTLTRVTLPNTVELIDSCAFLNCANLTAINLPAGMKKIGNRAFEGTGIAPMLILLPHALVFANSDDRQQTLTALMIPVEAQDDMTWTVVDDRIAAVADGVVTPKHAGATRITVTWAGLTAECVIVVRGEDPLTLPASLHEIGEEAFAGSPAREIVLPEGVRRVGSRAFADCANLILVYMPDDVAEIAEDAFDSGVVFLCESDNAAAAFAQARGIPFAIWSE